MDFVGDLINPIQDQRDQAASQQPSNLRVAARARPGGHRARKNLDRHPNYILAAYMASGT